jgi:cell division protein FtsX
MAHLAGWICLSVGALSTGVALYELLPPPPKWLTAAPGLVVAIVLFFFAILFLLIGNISKSMENNEDQINLLKILSKIAAPFFGRLRND